MYFPITIAKHHLSIFVHVQFDVLLVVCKHLLLCVLLMYSWLLTYAQGKMH